MVTVFFSGVAVGEIFVLLLWLYDTGFFTRNDNVT